MSTDYFTVITLEKKAVDYTDQLEDIATTRLKQKTLEVIIAAAPYPYKQDLSKSTDKTNLCALTHE